MTQDKAKTSGMSSQGCRCWSEQPCVEYRGKSGRFLRSALRGVCAGPLHIPYDVVAGSGYKRAARRAAVRFLGGYNARFWARGPRIWAGTNGRRAGVLSSSGYKSTQSLAGLPPNCNHTRVSGRVLYGTAAVFIENLARMWTCTIPGYALAHKY